MVKTDTKMDLKVRSVLISQPKPETDKSPYFDLAQKFNLKLEFRPFIQVEVIDSREFRKQRIDLNEFTAVIFTSRNAIDHYFHICEEMRVKVSQDMKYFCVSEAIALYLQKYVQYRKRKVFFGDGAMKSIMTYLNKHKDNEKFLLPCSDIRKADLPEFLRKNKFDFTEAIFYHTVASDLSDLKELTFDMIVFFSPVGVKSLFHNFPNFKQENTRIAAFGPTTCKAVIDAGLRLDVKAPIPQAPSMSMAIEKYLKELSGK
jgi:uroporphyrinogen-III synthase